MHLQLFIPDLSDFGAQRVLVNLANSLHKSGASIDVVTFYDAGELLDQLDGGIPVTRTKSHFDSVRFLRIVGWLIAYLRIKSPHGEVVVSFAPITNLFSLLKSRISGSRVVIQEHALQSRAMLDRDANPRIWALFYRLVLVRMYSWADQVWVPSEAIKDDLVTHFGVPRELVHVVTNPVDLERVANMMAAECPMQVREPIILAAGRLAPQKNIPRLLRAFSIVAQQHPEVSLVLIGQGPLRPALEKLAHDMGIGSQTSFLGFQSNPYAYMSRARCLVLSSDWEGLPQVIAESMACGRTVVATNCPSGPSEMIVDFFNGRLAETGSVDSLAHCLDWILSNPDRTEEMSRNALALANSRYGLDVYTDRVQRLLNLLD